MSLDNIKNRFELIDKEISNKVFRRKQLMETLDEKQKNFLNLKALRNNANKSDQYGIPTIGVFQIAFLESPRP